MPYLSSFTSSSSLLAFLLTLKVFLIFVSVFWTGTRDFFLSFHNASTVGYLTTKILCSVYLVIRTGNIFIVRAVFSSYIYIYISKICACLYFLCSHYCTCILYSNLYNTYIIMLCLFILSQSVLQVVGIYQSTIPFCLWAGKEFQQIFDRPWNNNVSHDCTTILCG